MAVRHTSGHDDLILVSSEGKAIRFHEYDVRPTGRATMGVQGMRMPDVHVLVGMAVAEYDADLFCVTSGGYCKRTPTTSYPTQKRGGLGVITIKDASDRGDLIGVTSVRNNHELMLMSQDGTVIRVQVESVRCTGRNTMGVRVMHLRGADKVSSMARLVGGNGGGNGVDVNGVGESGDVLGGAALHAAGPAGDDDFDESIDGEMDAEDDIGEDVEPEDDLM